MPPCTIKHETGSILLAKPDRISGMICDFDVYQGSVNGIRAKSELGLSGDVVMKLASTLPEGQNYKIYADNYFTCVPLVVKLLDRGIHYPGRCATQLNLEEEKSLKKKGRGSFDIRWRPTTTSVLSNGMTAEWSHLPCAENSTLDKANKTYVEVERPSIVGTYNKYMGGVDLLDLFTAKYKFPMQSRRWYVYIFWYTIILAVINAWLLYKRECKALKMPKQEILNRRQFQADLASSLILVNTTPLKTPKRGQPSSGNGSPVATVTSRSPLNAQKRPSSGEGVHQTGPHPKITTSTESMQGPNGTFSSEDKEKTLQTLQ
ncbi:hypothetical protein F7725_028990 [Dissostichus mawsoni]|uniref:PiggyBac transposable element-derived protein domain-containing protein n=1 Tax=Dissostichus mawsoni TaxID=36200 RepID=A0A7J5XH68_DISMA|nr:hypothetical protein F7725_028990 [Dissostichus mawsoni]